MLLKITGNETHTAFDGLEAMETAEIFRPDVVLLDIGLPKMNGYETARLIYRAKKMPQAQFAAGIPIQRVSVQVTANGSV